MTLSARCSQPRYPYARSLVFQEHLLRPLWAPQLAVPVGDVLRFQSTSFGGPNTLVGSPTFGTISSAGRISPDPDGAKAALVGRRGKRIKLSPLSATAVPTLEQLLS